MLVPLNAAKFWSKVKVGQPNECWPSAESCDADLRKIPIRSQEPNPMTVTGTERQIVKAEKRND